MQIVRCSNSRCNKVVGEVEIEVGKARFKCKCGTYTTVEFNHTQRAPQAKEVVRHVVGR